MWKKCSMIYWILLPKAEDGCIKPYQCQVNSTCLELTYYIETLNVDLCKLFEEIIKSPISLEKTQNPC